jgi:hypothetical protein
VAIIAGVGLLFLQYQSLVSLLGKDQPAPTSHHVCLLSGVEGPRLLPSYEDISDYWCHYIMGIRGLQLYCLHNDPVTIWPLQDILNFIFLQPELVGCMAYWSPLDIICQSDEYPQAGKTIFADTFMLRNFGVLLKTLPFSFLSIITTASLHQPDLIKAITTLNNALLAQIVQEGWVTVYLAGQPLIKLATTVWLAGDDVAL